MEVDLVFFIKSCFFKLIFLPSHFIFMTSNCQSADAFSQIFSTFRYLHLYIYIFFFSLDHWGFVYSMDSKILSTSLWMWSMLGTHILKAFGIYLCAFFAVSFLELFVLLLKKKKKEKFIHSMLYSFMCTFKKVYMLLKGC